eukprot:CAMPEP_0182432576 /NCGR_PEP_ID=MMETSP1167-20130531/57413_1 /TAXON_ID=2988 /ORGANISM="Mallomonas Sp, Strain CCMP3275" /LENGTH=75 /DNA_ID=CAMNT_0024620257 /DNA_START=336 /DNA_END=560 /DNA_ORIENTATION=-
MIIPFLLENLQQTSYDEYYNNTNTIPSPSMIGMKGMYLFPDMDIGRLIDSWTLWGDQWGHRPGMFDSIVYPTAFW